jgi:MioC protein
MSSERIGIFVATMTGTAEICAEEIAGALASAGIRSETLMMDGLDTAAFDDFDRIVIISSTYGQGDIPDNGQALFEAVEAAQDLSYLRFAVFGLGDMTYAATFCAAGTRWDALFEAKRARRFAPLVRHDASSGVLAEDEAAAWAVDWAQMLRTEA